jgi:predicted ribosomally synthesized peptide with SipW-like signal peptide
MKGGEAMGSTNRKRALLVSGSVILLCLTVITGMTLALFTDDEVVTNHLKAGDLDVTLVRTKLTSTYLTERGFLDTVTDDRDKDFTNGTDENVFALDGAVIVPQSKYIAEMQVSNQSDVAFGYWVEIVYTGSADVELADQIEITVNTAQSKRLSQGLVVGSEKEPIGVIAVGEAGEFTVTVEFLDLANSINNQAQGDEVTFDLVVHAVQYTGADPDLAS